MSKTHNNELDSSGTGAKGRETALTRVYTGTVGHVETSAYTPVPMDGTAEHVARCGTRDNAGWQMARVLIT